MKKKLLAMLLAMVLLLGMLPVSAMAAEPDAPENTVPDFSAKAGDTDLATQVYQTMGYSYTDYTTQKTVSVPVYTMVVPDGTTSVDLSFSENVLAYNYTKSGDYLCGYYEDYMTGSKTAAVPVDYGDEKTPADGAPDYIQVQSPYDADWNSTVYYAITFLYAGDIPSVSASVGGAELTVPESQSSTYTYPDYTGNQITVPVYTVAVPEEAVSVDLSFSENVLAYNYTESGDYLCGYYEDYMTGSKTAAVPVDYGDEKTPADGCPDYIQVQSPYDADWNSTLYYAITFVRTTAAETAQARCAACLDANVTPAAGYSAGDWTAVGLARSGCNVSAYSYEKYYDAVLDVVLDSDGKLSARKYTEYARTSLGLEAIGVDPAAVCGYDLLSPLADYDTVTAQGLNGTSWALIALNGAKQLTEAEKSAREKYVQQLLETQLPDGGWCLTGTTADPDITAMVLTAFSGVQTEAGVSAAIEKGVACLAALQNSDGTFTGSGEKNCESCAQVIIALSSLGIDPADSRFEKDGKKLMDVLLSYQLEDGSFCHKAGAETNQLATEQAMLALDAAVRYQKNEAAVFACSDAEELVTVLPFRDVRHGDWYYDKVAYAYENKLVYGETANTFEPEHTVTRCMLSALLYRMAGSPQVTGTVSFTDVPADSYYYSALVWATQNHLIYGYDEKTFGPDDPATREQLAAILMRYAQLQKQDTTGRASLSGYTDAESIDAYAENAMAWAVDSGIIYGRTATTLVPQGNADRAEATAMLVRYLQNR